LLQFLNDDSDKKKIKYPILKLDYNFKENKNLNKFKNFVNLASFDKNYFNYTDLLNFNLPDQSDSHKLFSLFSSNQTILTDSKGLRSFINMKPNVTTLNHDTKLTTSSSYLNLLNTKNMNGNFFFFNLNTTN